MTNDEYAARHIMGWTEKMSGWVSPDGFIDRAFWKPSTDRKQLYQVVWNLAGNIKDELEDDHGLCAFYWMCFDSPTAALEAIVQAHKNQKEG